MSDLPTVTVIIPIAPGGECQTSLESVRAQDYDAGRIQILVAVGRHRSIQRNEALARATGEFIWFMDNDVTVRDAQYLRRHVAHYQDPEVASVGGPSLTPDSDSFFQRSVGQVLGSYLATQSVRARYAQVGKVRRTTERELILCSQTFRTSCISKKGFDSRLHSGNEENELMNRLDRSGHKLIYDPQLVVFRSQRPTLKDFFLQIGKYGKSRMEHFLIRPSAFEVLFLVPLGFMTYLTSLALLPLLPLKPLWQGLGLAPLAVYDLAVLVSSIAVAVRGRSFGMLFSAALLFPVVHLAYAIGNLFGIYRYVFPDQRVVPPVEVRELT